MKIKSIGANKTELHLKDLTLLISYETPVSLIRYSNNPANWNDSTHDKAIKTAEFHSVTTSKHINQWLKDNGFEPDKVPTIGQEFFNEFLDDNE